MTKVRRTCHFNENRQTKVSNSLILISVVTVRSATRDHVVKFNTRKTDQTLTIFKDALETREVSSFSMGVFWKKIFGTVS